MSKAQRSTFITADILLGQIRLTSMHRSWIISCCEWRQIPSSWTDSLTFARNILVFTSSSKVMYPRIMWESLVIIQQVRPRFSRFKINVLPAASSKNFKLSRWKQGKKQKENLQAIIRKELKLIKKEQSALNLAKMWMDMRGGLALAEQFCAWRIFLPGAGTNWMLSIKHLADKRCLHGFKKQMVLLIGPIRR